jgi:hypothetical protein
MSVEKQEMGSDQPRPSVSPNGHPEQGALLPVTRRRWDAADDEYLRTWGYMGAWHMANDLDRTEASVRQRAASIGVRLGLNGCGHTGADTTKERCHCGALLWPIHRMTAKWNGAQTVFDDPSPKAP